MRTNVGLWWLLVGFFFLMATIYTIWSIIAHPDLEWYHGIEWVGTVALLFTSLMSALIAFYIGRVHKAQGGDLPEDTLTADIDDGDPELGEFSPWSWWPIVLAFVGGARHDRPRHRNLDHADRHRRVPRGDRRLGVRVLPRSFRTLSVGLW